MGIFVKLNEGTTETYATGTKWIVDDHRNLVVVDAASKALGIHAVGSWVIANSTDSTTN